MMIGILKVLLFWELRWWSNIGSCFDTSKQNQLRLWQNITYRWEGAIKPKGYFVTNWRMVGKPPARPIHHRRSWNKKGWCTSALRRFKHEYPLRRVSKGVVVRARSIRLLQFTVTEEYHLTTKLVFEVKLDEKQTYSMDETIVSASCELDVKESEVKTITARGIERTPLFAHQVHP